MLNTGVTTHCWKSRESHPATEVPEPQGPGAAETQNHWDPEPQGPRNTGTRSYRDPVTQGLGATGTWSRKDPETQDPEPQGPGTSGTQKHSDRSRRAPRTLGGCSTQGGELAVPMLSISPATALK